MKFMLTPPLGAALFALFASGCSATPADPDEPGRLGVAQQALPFGTTVGTFNGVDAYSNGSIHHVSGIHGCCGLEWQCVEYVNRFYNVALGHENLSGTGNADAYFGTASQKGLVAFPNGGQTGPAVGDMIVSNGGSNGHIAIVREVGPSHVTVIQQNWSNDTSDNAKTLSLTHAGGGYTVEGFNATYPVKGWMREPVRACASVSSVSPSSATRGVKTLFTITGTCLPSSIAPFIEECVDPRVESIGPTQATFSCTPSYTSGSKQGVIKTQAGGTPLTTFALDVN